MVFGCIFYLFSGLMMGSAFLVLVSRNAVHSALWLIFAFLNASGLFILLGSEMIAMIFILIYVGAVIVLFLFMMMMVGSQEDLGPKKIRYNKSAIYLVGLFLGSEFLLVGGGWKFMNHVPKGVVCSLPLSDLHSIGKVLYTHYGAVFQISGFILVSAMLGIFVLTHRSLKETSPQSLKSSEKESGNSITLCKVDINSGI